MYGPKWPFLLRYGSRDTRRIDFPRVDRLSTDTPVLGRHNVRKINVVFPTKQNILLAYVIMSLGNFYLFKSHVWKIDLRMFMVRLKVMEIYFCIFVKLKT